MTYGTCVIWCALGVALAGQAAPVIRVTDTVLAGAVEPIGINLGGDNYYSAPLLVDRTRENYEGVMYRENFSGTLATDCFVATATDNRAWTGIWIGATWRILSGAARWQTGAVVDVTVQGANPVFWFDRPVTFGGASMSSGLMVERPSDQRGFFSKTGTYDTNQSSIVTDAVRPGAFGRCAMRLNGSFSLRLYNSTVQMNPLGAWQFAFWATCAAGSSNTTLTINPPGSGPVSNIVLRTVWTYYSFSLPVNAAQVASVSTSGGAALLDDIQAWKIGDGTNPTVFRDELVAMLRRLRFGVIRQLRMSGDTLENSIRPVLQKYAWLASHTGAPDSLNGDRDAYGLHDLYQLCEHVGAEPWYCLPGTLTREEMSSFMEYLAAPTNIGMGALRGELGHAQPWTEVFKHIHLEFANEPNTYAGASYTGPDYWHDLIKAAKDSPYYRTSVLFRASQIDPGTVLARATNLDMYCKALYICFNLWSNQIATVQSTPEKMLNWASGYSIHTIMNPTGAFYKAYQPVQAAGKEFGLYEGSYHTSYGSDLNNDGTSTIKQREWITVSAGGAIGYLNGMLLALREEGARHQAYFNLLQSSMAGFGGTFPRGWGCVNSMRSDGPRLRPMGYGLALLNAALTGALVATVHEGSVPQFMAAGPFADGIGAYKAAETNYYPVLWSYACKAGPVRTLIVVNLDTVSNQTFELRLPREPQDYTATAWLLTSSSITNINEDFAFDVTTNKILTLNGFSSGTLLTVPRCSIQSFTWTEAAANPPPQIIAEPTNVGVAIGAPAGFRVQALGAAPLLYGWQSNNASAIQGATAAQFNIPAVTLNDTGDYRVIVSNTFGAATSQWATLSVVPEPWLLPGVAACLAGGLRRRVA